MKTANGLHFTCKMFEEAVSDYIDTELSDDSKKAFLAHAQVCPKCNELLRDFQSLKMRLGGMTPANVSSDFDQRLSVLLRNESVRMRDPKYRFRLFVLDNWKVFTTIPAAAVLVFGIVFLRPNVHYNNMPMDIAMTEQAGNTLDDEVDAEEEVVMYVLESVKENDAENGVFLNEHHLVQRTVSSSDADIKLISF